MLYEKTKRYYLLPIMLQAIANRRKCTGFNGEGCSRIDLFPYETAEYRPGDKGLCELVIRADGSVIEMPVCRECCINNYIIRAIITHRAKGLYYIRGKTVSKDTRWAYKPEGKTARKVIPAPVASAVPQHSNDTYESMAEARKKIRKLEDKIHSMEADKFLRDTMPVVHPQHPQHPQHHLQPMQLPADVMQRLSAAQYAEDHIRFANEIISLQTGEIQYLLHRLNAVKNN